MTTIQVDDEIAHGLNAQARALGLSLQDYLRSITGNGSRSGKESANAPYDQWSAKLRAWAANFPTLPQAANDSRESIYSGRGE